MMMMTCMVRVRRVVLDSPFGSFLGWASVGIWSTRGGNRRIIYGATHSAPGLVFAQNVHHVLLELRG